MGSRKKSTSNSSSKTNNGNLNNIYICNKYDMCRIIKVLIKILILFVLNSNLYLLETYWKYRYSPSSRPQEFFLKFWHYYDYDLWRDIMNKSRLKPFQYVEISIYNGYNIFIQRGSHRALLPPVSLIIQYMCQMCDPFSRPRKSYSNWNPLLTDPGVWTKHYELPKLINFSRNVQVFTILSAWNRFESTWLYKMICSLGLKTLYGW